MGNYSWSGNSNFASSGGSGAGFVLVGLASMVGSIPIFINSAKNKGRAEGTVNFKNQQVLLPYQNNFSVKLQPTISVKLVW